MDDSTPQAFLEITGPNGQSMITPLTKTRTTIGRYPPPTNDIALQPDPQRYVTREIHCYLEHERQYWYLVSNGKNLTLLSRGAERWSVCGKEQLADGDKIYIQGGLSESGEPEFWELLYRDPEETDPASLVPYLEYEQDSCKLFKVERKVRSHISLRPLEHKLISYMLKVNQQSNNTPVLIPVSDLMQAVWEEDEGGTSHILQELHKLISSLRGKVEHNPKKPQFLVNERGLGYLLYLRPLGE